MSLGDVGENVVSHLFVAPDLCIEDYEKLVVLESSRERLSAPILPPLANRKSLPFIPNQIRQLSDD
jgi:hypothetical protein